MAQDFAKKRKSTTAAKKPSTRKRKTSRKAAAEPARVWRWYFSGVLTGLFACFFLYLATLPDNAAVESATPTTNAPAAVAEEPPKPRFDFYTLLPE